MIAASQAAEVPVRGAVPFRGAEPMGMVFSDGLARFVPFPFPFPFFLSQSRADRYRPIGIVRRAPGKEEREGEREGNESESLRPQNESLLK